MIGREFVPETFFVRACVCARVRECEVLSCGILLRFDVMNRKIDKTDCGKMKCICRYTVYLYVLSRLFYMKVCFCHRIYIYI